MIIGVEFDGTIVEYNYPKMGKPVPEAIATLKELEKSGHKIILCTVRDGKELTEALDFLKKNEVKLFGVNKNPHQYVWSKSKRVYANIYINSAAFGAPLKKPKKFKKKCLDWSKVQEHFLLKIKK